MFSVDKTAAQYVKAHGSRAREVMTREVQTVMPNTPVAEIATLLESQGIKRVPAMRGDEIVGIVSRANLVQALAGMPPAAIRVTPPADQAIRGRLLGELARQSWLRQAASNMIVIDGVVHYFGTIDIDAERDAARIAAENTPGVRAVEDHRVPFQRIAAWE